MTPYLRTALLSCILLGLIGCGPTDEQLAAARQRIATAQELHAQTLTHLENLELRHAAESFARLHAMTRTVNIEALEIPVDGQSSLQVAEELRDHLRGEIESRLPILTERYLHSRLAMAELDELLLPVLGARWESRRRSVQALAATKAEHELRLVFTGASLPAAIREAVIDSLRARMEGVGFNLGYDLPQPPEGLGTIEINVEQKSIRYDGPDRIPLGLIPFAINLDMLAHARRPTSWDSVKAITAQTVPISPDHLAGLDAPTAEQEFRRIQSELLTRLATLIREQIAALPPLAVEST